jgi:hypothetical protein
MIQHQMTSDAIESLGHTMSRASPLTFLALFVQTSTLRLSPNECND